MGRVALSSKNYDTAETYFQKVVEMYRESPEHAHKSNTLESYIHISKIYKMRKQYDKQIDFLNEASEFAITDHLQNVSSYNVSRKDNIQLKRVDDKTDLVKSSLLSYSLEKKNKLLEQIEFSQKEKTATRTQKYIIYCCNNFMYRVDFLRSQMNECNE